ncbi:MAG TPA: alpha/beta hydrolase [Caulobacteraceae bacterium]|jgi:pimeloyl-ACP methyl ester carboxylesterase
MDRRQVVIGAGAVAAVATALPAWAAFASDRISVETRGEGPDVILIHGLSSRREVWQGTVDAVPGYRYHLVQIAGMGGAPAAGAADGPIVAPAAEEIARYIAEAGLTKPAIVGHSMGGEIALMIAARHPEWAGKVMVVDMLPFMGVMFGQPPMTSEKARPMADQIRSLMIGAPRLMYEQQLEETVGAMVANEALRPSAIADAKRSDRTVSANAFYDLVVTDLRPELANIAAPVTVLYVHQPDGPLTEAQMDAVYRFSYATLKGTRLVKIPGSRHFIMWDQPERFQAEMKAFLAA